MLTAATVFTADFVNLVSGAAPK